MKKSALDLRTNMKEAAVQYILEQLGLEDLFSTKTCDRKRNPYSPSVKGWNNGKYILIT
jgi:hypothetical protein